MTRPIPPVSTKYYASPGSIFAQAHTKDSTVKLEVHHCTAYLDKLEATTVILQLLKASKDVWGQDCIDEIVAYVEQG